MSYAEIRQYENDACLAIFANRLNALAKKKLEQKNVRFIGGIWDFEENYVNENDKSFANVTSLQQAAPQETKYVLKTYSTTPLLKKECDSIGTISPAPSAVSKTVSHPRPLKENEHLEDQIKVKTFLESSKGMGNIQNPKFHTTGVDNNARPPIECSNQGMMGNPAQKVSQSDIVTASKYVPPHRRSKAPQTISPPFVNGKNTPYKGFLLNTRAQGSNRRTERVLKSKAMIAEKNTARLNSTDLPDKIAQDSHSKFVKNDLKRGLSDDSISNSSIDHEKLTVSQKAKKLVADNKVAKFSNLPNNSMIGIQVFGENKMLEELLIQVWEVSKAVNKYPGLEKIIPAINSKLPLIPYDKSAVQTMLKFIFNQGSDILDWDIAIQALDLSRRFHIPQLQVKCQSFIESNNITVANASHVYLQAKSFKLLSLADMCLQFMHGHSIAVPQKHLPAKHCTIYCCNNSNSNTFCLPLYDDRDRDLGNAFLVDLTNELEFTAVKGSCFVTGIQIKLNAGLADRGQMIMVSCDVGSKNHSMYEEREKEIAPLIVIRFEKPILVGEWEQVTIVVTIENIYPKLCQSVMTRSHIVESNDGIFKAKFKSNQVNRSKLFLYVIEKVMYVVNPV